LLRRCAANEQRFRHRKWNRVLERRGGSARHPRRCRPLSVRTGLAVITEPHPNGKSLPPDRTRSPGRKLLLPRDVASPPAGSQLTRSVVRSPVPSEEAAWAYQTHRSSLAPGRQAAWLPWSITGLLGINWSMVSPEVRFTCPWSGVKGPVLNSDGLCSSTTISGAGVLTASHQAAGRPVQHGGVGPVFPEFTRATRLTRANHQGQTGGTTRGRLERLIGQIGLTTMHSMPGCRIGPPPPSIAREPVGVEMIRPSPRELVHTSPFDLSSKQAGGVQLPSSKDGNRVIEGHDAALARSGQGCGRRSGGQSPWSTTPRASCGGSQGKAVITQPAAELSGGAGRRTVNCRACVRKPNGHPTFELQDRHPKGPRCWRAQHVPSAEQTVRSGRRGSVPAGRGTRFWRPEPTGGDR